MIDTIEQVRCKACGKPLTQRPGRGHRQREYCNAACRQRAHRQSHPASNVTIGEREALMQRIQELEARLDIEQRFRTDHQVRHFKSWLRKHPQAQDTDFAKRFIADTRLPEHASRGLYGAHLRLYKYSEKDLYLFQEAWKDMMFNQS